MQWWKRQIPSINVSHKGHFVTLEGGEGAGKSSLMLLLAEHLRSAGYEVVTTREPGGTALGEQIRNMLLRQEESTPVCAQAELLLMLAARVQHVETVIRPALQQGAFVLCDRFHDSTIAYQGGGRELGVNAVRHICHQLCGPLEPQLTLWLDVPPQIGLARAQKIQKVEAAEGQLDRIEGEKLDFHQRVYQAFRLLAKREPLRIYRIDATRAPDYVLKEAVRALQEFILLPPSGQAS